MITVLISYDFFAKSQREGHSSIARFTFSNFFVTCYEVIEIDFGDLEPFILSIGVETVFATTMKKKFASQRVMEKVGDEIRQRIS
jgi:hypothetical protein